MPKHGEESLHLVSLADKAMYDTKRIPDEEEANEIVLATSMRRLLLRKLRRVRSVDLVNRT